MLIESKHYSRKFSVFVLLFHTHLLLFINQDTAVYVMKILFVYISSVGDAHAQKGGVHNCEVASIIILIMYSSCYALDQ